MIDVAIRVALARLSRIVTVRRILLVGLAVLTVASTVGLVRALAPTRIVDADSLGSSLLSERLVVRVNPQPSKAIRFFHWYDRDRRGQVYLLVPIDSGQRVFLLLEEAAFAQWSELANERELTGWRRRSAEPTRSSGRYIPIGDQFPT